MRALVYHNNILAFERNYALPAPAHGEALIRVVLAGVCNTDLEIVRGYMGFQGVPGHEFVGVVEDISGGDELRAHYRYLPGQRVVGEINAACQQPDCFYCQRGMPTQCPRRTTLGIVNRNGVFADYVTLPLVNLHVVPEHVSDEEAVFVEPLAANFEILEQVHLKPTERVIIIGDGKMGQLAAQVLSLSGCNLTMVGHNTGKLALAARRGVHTCLTDEQAYRELEQARSADVVVECSGAAEGLAMALRLVRPRGSVILKSTVADSSTLHLAPIVIDEIRVQGSRCGPFAPALHALDQRLVDVRSLISARYPLSDGIAAFKHAEQKDALKVLIQM